MKNIIVILISVFTIISCNKSETLNSSLCEDVLNKNGNAQSGTNNNLQKIIQDKDMIQFVNDNLALYENTINMDYILEISQKNQDEITQEDLLLVSDALGFDSYDNFESFFIAHTERIKLVNNRHNIENLRVEQLELVISRIISNRRGIGVGDDIEPIEACLAKYNNCVAAVASGTTLGVIGCALSGPFYIVCAAAVGVGTVSGMEACRQALIDCRNGNK